MRRSLLIFLGFILIICPVLISCGDGDDADSISEPSVSSQTSEPRSFNMNHYSTAGSESDESGYFGSDDSAGMDFGSQSWPADRMIVQTGKISLKVSDIAATLESIKEITSNLGGYVVSSNWGGGEKQNSATISIRVPAHEYDSAAISFRDLAIAVLSESTESDDVTEEYTDLEAQLRNLETTESRYLELLQKAQTIEEMLKVEGMISQTRGKIEQTVGRIQYLERTSATSLITISLVEEAELAVDFVADRIEIDQDGEVFFVNQTTGGSGPFGYHWEFGDGTVSTEQHPESHTFKKSKRYTVSLTVTDSKGISDTETKSEYITVVGRSGWSPSSIAGSAWNGLVNISHVLIHIIIWVGILSVIWGPVAVAIYWYRRKQRRTVSQEDTL